MILPIKSFHVKLLLLAGLLLVPWRIGSAQALVVCNLSNSAPCVVGSDPGAGTIGMKAFNAFGTINQDLIAIAPLYSNVNPNLIAAGPSSGSAGPWSFRQMVVKDLPLFSTLGAATALSATDCIVVNQTGSNLCSTPLAVLNYVLANIPTITYAGLGADPSVMSCSDLVALASAANSNTIYTVNPCQIGLFVGSYNIGGSGTSATPNCLYENNYGTETASAGTFTVNAPASCTAAEGQKLLLHLKFTNVQTYSWNAAYVGGTTALPTASTGSSKGDWLAFRYDSINSKWDFLAASTGF